MATGHRSVPRYRDTAHGTLGYTLLLGLAGLLGFVVRSLVLRRVVLQRDLPGSNVRLNRAHLLIHWLPTTVLSSIEQGATLTDATQLYFLLPQTNLFLCFFVMVRQ